MLTKKYEGAIYEAKTLKNEHITSGIIGSIDGSEIVLIDPEGSMPIVPVKTPIKISVYSADEGFRVMGGQVYLSNPDFMRIVDVIDYINFERRRFFRVDVDIICRLTVPPAILARKGIVAEEPHVILTHLRDLSLCGMRMETDLPLKKGDEISVDVMLGKGGEHELKLAVRRVGDEGSGGKRLIGAEIIEISPQAERQLSAYLFELQRQHIRRMKSGT